MHLGSICCGFYWFWIFTHFGATKSPRLHLLWFSLYQPALLVVNDNDNQQPPRSGFENFILFESILVLYTSPHPRDLYFTIYTSPHPRSTHTSIHATQSTYSTTVLYPSVYGFITDRLPKHKMPKSHPCTWGSTPWLEKALCIRKGKSINLCQGR